MKYKLFFIYAILIYWSSISTLEAQSLVSGKIIGNDESVVQVKIKNLDSNEIYTTDSLGNYKITLPFNGEFKFEITADGYTNEKITIRTNQEKHIEKDILLWPISEQNQLDDVVISGTLKPVKRLESPIPVEVYNQAYFKKNPTPSIFDALQNVNGVRPQLNCNICNTGDIHINGLEGPYTMILIDGMPIVSALSTVYGLSGIPNALVERIEIVKGPASSLYGSEAVGGLINIITKSPENAPRISADIFGSTWEEFNIDLGLKTKINDKIQVLTGINYFNFQNVVDKNNDHFTDVTLQNRISVFQKWNFARKSMKSFQLAARYLYEDRWGGDIDWNKKYRGSDEIYGESIYTNRVELLGNYELPFEEKIMLSFSVNNHDQNSRYGEMSYIANQKIAFTQLTWNHVYNRHDLLVGAAVRYTYYDDNSPATENLDGSNNGQKIWLPGIFVQDEISLSAPHSLLLGFRYDHNNYHGNIFTPRLAYKWKFNANQIFRINAGTGFRVVNLFTEDHAALTGAREVEIIHDLKPEKSYNVNLNFIQKIIFNNNTYLGLDFSAFYTYFTNRIVPDYDTNPQKIIYDNLDGYATSKGLTLNADINFPNGLKIITGATLMENTITENHVTTQQMLTENFTGTWSISYPIKAIHLSIDYTGNVYSPMRLPLISDWDPRRAKSPWWSIQNIQFTYSGFKNIEIYAGIKNLLNWTPNKGNPFILPRTNDPFNQDVTYDNNGQVVPTANNPYGLFFDTSYVYGPNQGIRGFLGLRLNIR